MKKNLEGKKSCNGTDVLLGEEKRWHSVCDLSKRGETGASTLPVNGTIQIIPLCDSVVPHLFLEMF